ncbi:putative beta-galactosidase [Teratosphaeria nubilosa]|uniref:beta-galactosidase n=1 Tax=Teratosphaeria nubilosa TaxID=161662 RepID=A0A6G1LNJ6_9PEZI|nr:putative beta-galactosidase [Teratosphaeria nubilosa]
MAFVFRRAMNALSRPPPGGAEDDKQSPGGEAGSISQVPADWANLQILHRNTLAPRSNFVLYGKREDALERNLSKAKLHTLSGRWKFHLAHNPLEAPPGFEQQLFDSSKWSHINVPGMWQLQGFGRGPHYTNIVYPFHINPPYPPFVGNECGSYLTKFTVPRGLRDHQLRLRFEGVDSSFHVWLNGNEIGYSQGSRNASEFDVTDYVDIAGQNVLAVRVYQFSDGSYLEDQDQWWLSGIFRDVHLVGFPKDVHFEDLAVKTSFDDEYRDATLEVSPSLSSTGTVVFELLDANQNTVWEDSQELQVGKDARPVLAPIHQPKQWTAETPYLYTLLLSINNEQFLSQRIGFRQVEVKDGLLKVNGKRIVFKGANRHEHHPESGRAVPFEWLQRDLNLMKQHNINAIRTCHQPNDPRLYDLADEMGFWVMDEADLECHGFAMAGNSEQWASDNPEWQEAYVDRARQLVSRDKLHPSVVLWSLGNEAFYGRNHTAMVEYIKSVDKTRPIHYEQDYNADFVDIYSRMYPSVDDIINFAKDDSTKRKPIVLCEYIHAMGTGPGNIEEYIDAFYKYPRLQGGWVWEWANHGLLTKTKDGTPYYGYGGDFGDIPNDGNFVMDGVLQSDHTPNSGLIEYKKALEPVQLLSHTKATAVFINRQDFATLDHVVCTWKLVRSSNKSKEGGTLDLPPHIQPGTTFELDLPPHVAISDDEEALIEISFRLKNKTVWADAGYELAWAQIPLNKPAPVSLPVPETKETIYISPTATKLTISAGRTSWMIDAVRGSLVAWNKAGRQIITQPLEPTFYRALTDNDARGDGREWKDAQLHLARNDTRKVEWRRDGDANAVVTVEQIFAPPVLSWCIALVTTYNFSTSGAVKIHVKGTPRSGEHGGSPPATLPRIGVTFGLPKAFQQVSWFGRGPGESYRDMKQSQKVDQYSFDRVDELWTGPEFPQECSHRTDVRILKLSDGKGAEVTAQMLGGEEGEGRLFDFMACHYDVKDIDEARHPYELEKKKREDVVLRLDAAHHGLGTASCGPKTTEKNALKTEAFEFGILLH